jgi:calcium channel MID1
LFITLNICSLGTNTSILPSAIVSLQDPPDFALGRSNLDSDSGGLSIPNRLSRNGDPWSLQWNKGFANWTVNVPDNQFQASLLLAMGLDTEGVLDTSTLPSDLGNVVLHLGASTRREYLTAPEDSL